jgi:transcriptional regulator with XRE-family HTH domain
MLKKENQNEEWKLLVFSLKKIAKSKGITQIEIAKKTGLLQSNISRLFSLKYKPTICTLVKIAKSINVNLVFEEKLVD